MLADFLSNVMRLVYHVQTHIHKHYVEVFGDLQDVLASPCSKE